MTIFYNIQIMLKLYKNLYYYLKSMDKQLYIKINPEEQKIFNMLKKYRDELGLKTTMRVAGGWVRDKVLGKQSKDIDIALDNMKGEQFVTLIKHHAENNNEKISGFGVTKFNPQMSKHLETATAKIDNHWIDFVNLRCEEYNQQSRIPTMKFGTPLQDAQRRDFTINSLFYNLQTSQVQDCTGKGLEDLEQKILRTPLEPLITFKDDPLRILRCLRFKSRLDFKIDQKIYDAINNQEIKQALLKKVSKERVGTELSGLLKAQHFFSGLEDIKNYGLWNIVFEIPKESELYGKNQLINQIPEFSYGCTSNMINSLRQNTWMTQKQLITQQKVEEGQKKIKNKKKQKIQYPADELQLLILLSSMTYIYKKYQVKVGKTKSNLIVYMVKDQLKYPSKHADFALHFAETVDKLSQIKSMDNFYEIIRWLRYAQQKWELAIHFLNAYHKTSKQEAQMNLFKLREEIINRNLANCYLAEPPVDGTFLTKKGIKGPAIGKILENAIIWRVINPTKSNELFQKEYQQNSQFFISDKTYK